MNKTGTLLGDNVGLEIPDNDEGQPVNAEVVITGNNIPLGQPPECEHPALHAEVTVANITENPDGTGPIVARQAMLRAQCSECGEPFRMLCDTARPSRQHGMLGVVVDLQPHNG